MKRLTIAMHDDLYASLVEYAASESKRQVRKVSLGEAARTIVSERLESSVRGGEVARAAGLEAAVASPEYRNFLNRVRGVRGRVRDPVDAVK